jgi:hypothetical protein
MTKEFVVLCSAQRLAYQDANDGAGDYYAFGMNITAAIGVSPDVINPSVTKKEAAALRPWLWTKIEEVQATISKDGSTPPFQCKVIPLPAARPDLDYDALITELGNEYDPDREEHDGQLANVTVWRLPEGTKQVEKKAPLVFNLKQQHKVWHSSILQLSTYPYPIPQFLNLSFIVKVPKSAIADPKKPLFLAPIIPDTTFFTAATKPQGALADTGDKRGVLSWNYDNPTKTGLNVVAYLLPSQVEGDPILAQTGFFDMKTGWIKTAGTFEEDWRAYFERRAGEVFDLGDRLIDYLRDHVTDLQAPPPPGEPALVPFLQKITVGVMRDLAGTGLLPSFNGRSLPEDLTSGETDQEKQLTPTRLDQLRVKEQELFGDGPPPDGRTGDSKWREFLAANLPQVSDLRVLKLLGDAKKTPATEDIPQPVEECLSELEQLHKALLVPENLHTIVQKQWGAIFDKLEKELHALPVWAQSLKDKITALKPDFDYRSRLAGRNLGPVWNALRRIANDPAVAKGKNLDMQALVKALLVNHLEARLHISPQTETPTVNQSDYDHYYPELNANPQPKLKCDPAAPPAKLVDCIIADLRLIDPKTHTSKLDKLAQNVSPPADRLDKPTDVPHSVSLQAHLTTMLPDQQTAFDDVLNQISGVLVFLRDQSEGVWFCLNHARVNIRKQPQAGDKACPPPLHDKTNLIAAPSRINYQNALTQSLITYNNVPLVARSSLARIPEVAGNATVGPDKKQMSDTGTEQVCPLIIYDYSTDPRAKIKALVFRHGGKLYEAGLCVVSASGALPKEISSPDKPWELDHAKLSTLVLTSDYLRSFPYMRKVRVGEIRSKSLLEPGQTPDPKAKNPLNLPPIPDGVYPRALVELPPEPPDPSRDPDDRPRILADKIPLLILAPTSEWKVLETTFQFRLRKPATDVETWHRWVNDGHNQAGRIGVLTEYYQTSDANRLLSKERTPADLAFDDPAVNGFYAELRRFDPDAPDPVRRWLVIKTLKIGAPPLLTPATLKDVQCDPLTVVCRSGAATGTDGLSGPTQIPCRGGGELRVNCCNGQIYRLLIYATVKRDDAHIDNDDTKRFAPVVADDFQDAATADIKLTSPFELLIETATEDLPPEDVVWRSLTPRFLSNDRSLPPRFFIDDGRGDRVEVTLESDDHKFRYVHRAEIQRQTWYWQGRETREFPALETAPFDFVNPDLINPASGTGDSGLSDVVRIWEEFEFAGRNDLDFTILDFKRAPELDRNTLTPGPAPATPDAKTPHPVPAKKRLFTYTEQLTPETENAQLSKADKEKSEQRTLAASGQQTSDGSVEKGDLRAHYYRFSAEVFSRYEGALPDGKAHSRRAHNPQAGITDEAAKWRRLFVPCRRKENPPVPKIKLILPLTETFVEHEATRSPGLLAVLNEPWYEWGGLGEGIIAEVETLADPHNMPSGDNDPCPIPGPVPKPKGQKFYFELGPDPILLKNDAAAIKARLLLPQSDTLNPAAVSTVSLEKIRGPVGHTHDETDEGALFTATSFIIPAPTVKNQVTPLTDLSWYMCKIRLLRQMRLKGSRSTDSASLLQSKATEAQWVQYLPEFSLFSCDRTVEDLYISVSATSIAIRNNKDDGVVNPAELSGPVESESLVFTPVLLLTRTAFNASGELNQEVYVGLCWPNTDNTWSLLPELPGVANDVLKNLLNNKEVHFRGRILGVHDVIIAKNKSFRPVSSKEFYDSLFAYNLGDKTDANGKAVTPAISDEQRPRIVRISQPISDVRGDPAKGKSCALKAAPPPAPPRRRR